MSWQSVFLSRAGLTRQPGLVELVRGQVAQGLVRPLGVVGAVPGPQGGLKPSQLAGQLLDLPELTLVVGLSGPTAAVADGNPRPGFPHDTIVIHVLKASSGPKLCTGGHSLFLRYGADGKIPGNTLIRITMIDWVQIDNDGDSKFDEDPPDGIDNDLDGNIDEDPLEPGAITTALDCDSWGDNLVSLQIRDADPRLGYVSTQEWFMRLIGKPKENFAFTSYANQKISCAVIGPGADGILGTADDVAQCVSLLGTVADWIQLAYFNLAAGVNGVECVKQVKLAGGGVKAGGKTPFCDITDGFEVDVDVDNNGTTDLLDQFVFSISCWDDPATLFDETLYCPLSGIIWGIDEEETTSKAKAQIFVAHTNSANVKTGRIVS